MSQEARAKGGGLRSKGDGFPGQPPNMKQGTDNLTKAGGAWIELGRKYCHSWYLDEKVEIYALYLNPNALYLMS